MIEYNNKVWFRQIVNFHKTDTLRKLFPEMLIVGAYAAILTYIHDTYLEDVEAKASFKNTTIVHSTMGFVLSLLLVFRTNTAYERWWEGRKLWGALVNSSRNLAIKISTIVPPGHSDTHHFFCRMIPNFCFALKEHLRGKVKIEELEDYRDLKARLEQRDHKPNLIIQDMFARAKTLVNEGQISSEEQLVIDKELKSFADIMGACERILKTPIPYSYSIFLKKFIFFFIISLPIGFVAYFDYWAIPISIFVFYVLVSLEIIAEEIEDPFGTDPNDLPTGKISETIRANVKEIFGEE